jgi:hypothetical protein
LWRVGFGSVRVCTLRARPSDLVSGQILVDDLTGALICVELLELRAELRSELWGSFVRL